MTDLLARDGLRKIDLLKVDVEGAEFEVLDRMASRGILGLVDVLGLECHRKYGHCHSLMRRIEGHGMAVKTESPHVSASTYQPNLDWAHILSTFREDMLSDECARFNISLVRW